MVLTTTVPSELLKQPLTNLSALPLFCASLESTLNPEKEESNIPSSSLLPSWLLVFLLQCSLVQNSYNCSSDLKKCEEGDAQL